MLDLIMDLFHLGHIEDHGPEQTDRHYSPLWLTTYRLPSHHWLATDASKGYKEAPSRIKDYNQG